MVLSFQTLGQTPVLYYSFDKEDTVTNMISNNFDGILGMGINKPTWTPNGCGGGYYQFDGDDLIKLPNPNLTTGNGNIYQKWTVSAWIRKNVEPTIEPVTDTTKSTYLIKGLNLGVFISSNVHAGYPNSSMIYLNDKRYTHSKYSEKPSVGDWYHLTYTLDEEGKKSRIYINGSNVDADTLPSGEGNNSSKLAGISDSMVIGFNFNGDIDELKIFNTCLTSVEVGILYGQTLLFNNCSGPLPVELLDFSATCYRDNVLLDWSTASEQNSDKFIIEKSRYLDNWTQIGEMKAQGNSNLKKNYTFIDDSWNGISYYRLRQIDLNGTEKIYGPISNECNRFGLDVLPNPSDGRFAINIYSNETYMKSNVVVSDLSGKVIHKRMLNIKPGTTIMEFNLEIESGSYIIRLENDGGTIVSKRFMVTQ